ncbi:MAG: alpha-L-fucosidase [Rikenellaceae bacterium]|nr:alpha-L-fucosidase [Rikenellaceae bacterium]MCL2692629.1 alpha-L-fucosidase [Rikenellaceae bacterium]
MRKIFSMLLTTTMTFSSLPTKTQTYLVKKILTMFGVVTILFGVLPNTAQAQTHEPPRMADIPGACTKWFEDARFGMFVHFGPYAVLGDGEWVMNRRPITAQNYLQLQDFFNPHAFDAAEWVKTAKDGGMKYIVFTSRHHDSFSNWATRESDWNIMNTPYGRDLIRQLADECRKQGMKLGLYYSTLDWMRDDYAWRTGRTGQGSGRTAEGDWNKYIAFMKAQLTELLTEYGDIAIIWFDGHWDQTADENRTDQSTPIDWHYPEIYGLIRKLQPNCLIANNHHLPPFPGEDYQIFERDVPGENKAGYSGQAVSTSMPLETCQTITRAWGFNINDDAYKSTAELLHLLVRTAGTGANLLLNVGPTPDGRIRQGCVERLQEMGQWLDLYGHTIYGTKGGWVRPQEWGAITTRGNTHYIHVLNADTEKLAMFIPGNVRSARWLNVDGDLDWTRDRRTGIVTFSFADVTLDPVNSIIEVVVR